MLDITNTFPEVIDSTMMAEFRGCPQAFFRRYVQGLDHPTPSIHLHAGGVMAKGLETVRNAFYRDGLSLDESLCRGIAVMVETWGDPSLVPEHKQKNLARCIWALTDYFTHFHPEKDSIQPFISPATGAPAVEFSFAVPLPLNHPVTGEPLIYAGKFDMLGIFNNALWVVDEKTTTQLGPSWMHGWDMRPQFTGYCWGARQFGYPVVGAIVRGIGMLSKETTFAEPVTYRPEWRIERWYHNLIQDLKYMLQCWDNMSFQLNEGEHCTSYGGCMFETLCNTLDPAPYLHSQYKIRRWHPLKGDE